MGLLKKAARKGFSGCIHSACRATEVVIIGGLLPGGDRGWNEDEFGEAMVRKTCGKQYKKALKLQRDGVKIMAWR